MLNRFMDVPNIYVYTQRRHVCLRDLHCVGVDCRRRRHPRPLRLE
jgi:hypothetical protein